MVARLHNLINPPPAPEPEPDPEPEQPVAALLPADVAAGSTHAEGVLTVLRLGIMELDPAAGFVPGRSMTRGDVARPLVRLWQVLGQECPTDTAEPFEDIDDLHLAADAGCLRGLGVTSGTGPTTFSPEQLVTRAQMASLLARVWRLSGRDCPDDAAPPFDDVAPSSSHHDAIACLRALGITSGTSASTFSPGSQVSRAQFATMVARLHTHADPAGAG